MKVELSEDELELLCDALCALQEHPYEGSFTDPGPGDPAALYQKLGGYLFADEDAK